MTYDDYVSEHDHIISKYINSNMSARHMHMLIEKYYKDKYGVSNG